MTMTGEYSVTCYRVFQDGREVYMASNAHGDSQAFVDRESSVGLSQMREFCETTTRDMAAELSAKYGGIQESDEEELP